MSQGKDNRATRSLWSRLNNPFVWCLLFLLAAEVAALVLWPSIPTAAEVDRNPMFRRFWPEFTRPPATTAKRVVIVSNSQGYGRRLYPDGIYTHYLQQELDPSRKRWVVENWSAPGARFGDLLALTAKALRQEPEVLLIVTYCNNFMKIHADPTYSVLDTYLILGEPLTLAEIPLSYLRQAVPPRKLAQFLVHRGSRLVRSRSLIWDYLQRWYHYNYRLVLGRGSFGKWSYWFTYPAKVGLPAAPMWKKRKRKRLVKACTGDPAGAALMTQMAAKHPATRTIVVFMPVREESFSKKGRQAYERFNRQVSEIMAPAGAAVWDLSWSVPSDQYYNVTHFGPKGHRSMAELLAKRLRRDAIQ